MAVGHALRDARESRGLSLDQIAGETHIPRHFLESIERDEFDQLPAPVYVRGFIRAYAGFLRMSAALLIDQLPDPWRQQGAAPVQVAAPVRRRRQPPDSDSWLTDWDAAPAVHRGPRDIAPPPPLIPAPELDPPAPLAPAVAIPPMRAVVRPAAPASRPLIDDIDGPEGESEPVDGVLSERPRGPRSRVVLVVAGAFAAVSAVVVATALLLGGGDEPSTPAAGGLAAGGAGPTATLSAGALATATMTEIPASPTTEPSPEPTATSIPPSPTPTVEAAATAVPPASAFAYCESLGGGNFSCGPSPWRVICAPTGPFFDPAGVIPRPIPGSWAGWSETTLTGRLENIWTACG